MSSVVISGNTSGTITLDAPNVAGTTVLTLPTANGTVLTTANTFGAGTGPAFSVYLNATQSISAATWTKITCQAESYDTANCYDNTTNYRFTPNVAGYYYMTAVAYVSTGTTAEIALTFRKNGTDLQSYTDLQATKIWSLNNSLFIYMNGTTDYIESWIYISAGTNNLVAGSTIFSGFLARSA